MIPVVIVEIDENSRVRILQDEGVRVGLIDRRIDGEHLTILPAANEAIAIDEAIGDLHILTMREDDPAKSAANTLLRLAKGQIVVVGLVDSGGKDGG